MSPLLAPLLAQIVTVQVADRTEGRYLSLGGNRRYEATTTPSVGVDISGRRSGLRLAYTPTVSVSPLEREPRRVTVFHTLFAGFGYRYRRTTLSLNSTFSIGSVNLLLLPLQGPQTTTNPSGQSPSGMPTANDKPNDSGDGASAGNGSSNGSSGSPTVPGNSPTNPTAPAAPGGPTMPGGPTTNPSGVVTNQVGVDQKVRFYVSTTSLNVGHEVAKGTVVSATIGSSVANGLDAPSRRFYPSLVAWFVGANGGYTYLISRNDSVRGNLSVLSSRSSANNEATTANATGGWGHQFNSRTSTGLTAGVNMTYFSQANGLAGISIFPTFQAGVSHQERMGRGALSLSAAATSTPVLDPLRALVDPRVGFVGAINYSRSQFLVGGSGGTTFSVAPAGNAGAVNSSQAEVHAGYQIAKAVGIDTGARYARQTYGGALVVPASWAVFVGLSLGYSQRVMGGRN